MNYSKLKYENYYTSVFSSTKMNNPNSSLDFYSRCFGEFLPLDKKLNILDFGAGLGNLSYWLKFNGYQNLTSIDISPEQCAMAKNICGIDVIHCEDTLQFLQNNIDKYDLVFMSDVIEHIPKIEMPLYLSCIKNSLKNNGRLILKTENVTSPTGLYQHFMDFTHEYNFVESSLRQLLMMVGFSDITIKGEPMRFPRRPWLWWKPLLRKLYWSFIRMIYEVEQPRSNNPTIFSKSLIASCGK